MAKVYVVTMGEYSDYHICAVALDKEKAEKLCKLFKRDGMYADEPNIEEWDTEKYEALFAGRKPYFVNFLKNGDVFSAGEKTWGIEYFEPGISETKCRLNGQFVPAISVELYAKDAESALKIAAEKRAKYLANKEGIA